ncbi:MAG: penicillin-binding transpeptidase domain-containing protein [Culicoidibacterales bacterium]
MNKKEQTKTLNIAPVRSQRRTINAVFIVFCCFFLSVFGRFAYIVYVGSVSGVNIQEFANNRNQKTDILLANRGNIVDASKNLIAQNIPSYTVVAVLAENQIDDKGQPAYVKDKDLTAKNISQVLNAPETYVREQLQKTNAFQIEFGKYGKDITLEQKTALENFKMPGITFMQGVKRYYPNGIFASNTIGFTSFDESQNKVIGKQGLESIYEEELAGKNGQKIYAANAQGMPIDPAAVQEVLKQEGMQIETTIDGNMQRFVEQTLKDIGEQSGAENAFAILINPKNGNILAAGQTPTFNANIKENITSNIFTDRVYEVGSVMKPITIASAIEDNHFNENIRFKSGSYKVDGITIYDYDKKGWGEIAYKDILCHSANTGISDLLLSQYPADLFQTKLDAFGFLQPADPMPNIVTGKASTKTVGNVVFKSDLNKVTTGFGQGTTSTLLQLLRSYTAIANDGMMVMPHVVNKVTNPNTGETYEYKNTTSYPISKQTAQKVRTLMVPVTETPGCTSNLYKMNGVSTAGKSGTAQISGDDGKYLESDNDTLSSFIGMVPAQSPELILYAGVMKAKNGNPGIYTQRLYTQIMNNALNYYSITQDGKSKNTVPTFTIPKYEGQETDRIKSEISQLSQKIVIIGNGSKIVFQSLTAGSTVIGNTMFLVTDGQNYVMPDLRGWSKKDVLTLKEYFHLKSEQDVGTGFVVSQSIPPGTAFYPDDTLNVTYK